MMAKTIFSAMEKGRTKTSGWLQDWEWGSCCLGKDKDPVLTQSSNTPRMKGDNSGIKYHAGWLVRDRHGNLWKP